MDTRILDFISEHLHSKGLDIIMKIFTILGEAGIFGISIAIICICLKKYRKIGFLILFAMVCGFLIGNLFLKNIIARVRPCVAFPSKTYFISCPKGYSMPSGHTLHSFIPAFILLFNKKTKVGIITFLCACMIAFSRMYFYVHYPSDILCGFVLAGFLSINICLIVNKCPKINKIFSSK